MTEFLLVGVGGFLGANARYAVNVLVAKHLSASLPWGTLAINVSGSFSPKLLLTPRNTVQPAATCCDTRGRVYYTKLLKKPAMLMIDGENCQSRGRGFESRRARHKIKH